MKKIIIMTLLITSQNIYAYGIDSNIAEIFEPSETQEYSEKYVYRAGFKNSQQQKNLEKYQMEVRQLKKESLVQIKNLQYADVVSKKIYQDTINKFSDELIEKMSSR